MKKIMITLAAALIAAGTSSAQINIGAGYAGTSHKFTEGDNSWYNGAYIQLGYNLSLGAGFEFSPALQYSCSFRNEEVTAGGSAVSATATNKYNEHYLNVPLMFNYGYGISENARIFVYAGPTASFGLYAGCKGKAETSIGGITAATDEKSASLYGENSDYGRWDIKIGGGVGIDIFGHYRLTVGYDYGLIDRMKADRGKLHCHGPQAGFAYLF